MAGNYDGSIRIDTSINSQPIDNGISAIENKIKSIGTAIGLAFGVKELIDFGKKAVTAASDLAEAQNVVDTAFGDMSWKMEQFAATALETYGISELTAKNMGSTYMAMAKGMGVATDAASDMAVTLTGRLSDIMSFYNKTQQQVDTIGRALITGETEPLKAIGVVMTQTNLSAYAMAQGFAKTYDEMSSNEQLLVRYKYFLEQTAMAQDDFAKTSEGWANQTRLLSERLNEFMTNFGSLIMNILTPALEFANEAVSFLNELFFGGNDSAEKTTAVKNAEAITDEVTSMGAAADKSKKKLNNLIAGFDELHIISGANSNKEDDQTTDAGIDTSNLLGVDLDADAKTAKKAAGKYRDIINEIYLAFKRHPLTKTIEGIIKSIGKFFGFIDGKDISAGGIVDTLMDILGAILAYKAVTGIVSGVSAFISGFGKLIGLITAHPVAAAVVGVVALAVGIYKLSQELERQRIADCFGDISISLEEIRELVDPITESIENVANAFEDKKTNLVTAKENFVNIAKAVQDTADAFKNNNLEQDVEGFANQLDELLNSALEVNNATFDTSAWEKAFLEDDGVIDDHEREILDRFKEMGSSVEDTIRNYGAKIHEITSAAIEENRALTEAEIENLESLYNKLAELTLTTDKLKSEATWERLKSGAYTFDSYAELAEEIRKAQEQEKITREEVHQSMYEDVLSMLRSELAAGKITEEEYEREKEKLFKEADEQIKEMEIKSARYQREVLLAFAQGAFTNIAKSYAGNEEDLKKIQEYYDLLTHMPDKIDKADLLGGALNYDTHINQLMMSTTHGILEDMKKQFGIDILSELEELDAAIGDSAFALDDYYKTIEETLSDFTGLDIDSILPTLEEFKDRPEAYTDILNKWLQYQSYSIQLGVEFDTAEATKQLNDFISQKYSVSPYVNANTNNGQDRQMIVNVIINDEKQETFTASQESGRTAAFNVVYDHYINNGR